MAEFSLSELLQGSFESPGTITPQSQSHVLPCAEWIKLTPSKMINNFLSPITNVSDRDQAAAAAI